MKYIIEKISKNFMQEAVASPRMLEDLAAMERYMSESYEGRTFVELLQNADDANASRLCVFTVGDAIVVANDGRPFNENDIMAICRSGASSKQRGNSIGYRGVGFKSATTISTEIVIYSADTYFTFSKSVCARELGKLEDQVPTVRIPFVYDESALNEHLKSKIEEYEGDGFTTFFLFLSGKLQKFINELDGFNAGWLIFLRHVGSVDIDCGIHKSKARITRKKVNDTDSIMKVVGSKDQWYVVSTDGVSIAFKYDPNNGIVACSNEEGVFHCFLPTLDKTGFPFKLNADFSTDPSRKHIIQDERTTDAIRLLQKVYGEFLNRIIMDSEEKLYAAVSLLNMHTTLNDLVVSFESGLLGNLRKTTWIPLNNGQNVVPENACILPKWLEADEKKIIVDVSKFVSSRVVKVDLLCGVEKIEQLLAKIGAKEIQNDVISEMISDLDVVKQISSSLFAKVFAYSSRTMFGTREWMDRLLVPMETGFVQLKDTTRDMVINGDFLAVLKPILNAKEIENLIAMYPVFGSLRASKKNSALIDLKKNDFKSGNMAKTAALAVNKWKTPVQNCMALETLNGNSVKDVKNKCDEYDIISTSKDGTISYIVVKQVSVLGESFKMSEHEYAAAQRLGDAFKIYVFSKDTSEIEYAIIVNPIDHLHLEKVVKEWEWLSGEYVFVNENVVEVPVIMDEKIIKCVDRSYFNGAQQEFLRKYLETPSIVNVDEYETMVEKINFVFDFHTGEEFFVRKNHEYIVDAGKKAALIHIMK